VSRTRPQSRSPRRVTHPTQFVFRALVTCIKSRFFLFSCAGDGLARAAPPLDGPGVVPHICPTTPRPASIPEGAAFRRSSPREITPSRHATLACRSLSAGAVGRHRSGTKGNPGFLPLAREKKRPVASPRPPFYASLCSKTVRLAEQKLNGPLTALCFAQLRFNQPNRSLTTAKPAAFYSATAQELDGGRPTPPTSPKHPPLAQCHGNRPAPNTSLFALARFPHHSAEILD
jgi:hypothetical protein